MATELTEERAEYWGGSSDRERDSCAEREEHLRGLLRAMGLSPTADATRGELQALLADAEQRARGELQTASRLYWPHEDGGSCRACGGMLRISSVLAKAVDQTRREVLTCTQCRRPQRCERKRRAGRLEPEVSGLEQVRHREPRRLDPTRRRKTTWAAVTEETWATSGPWSSSLSWLGSSVAWSGSGDEAVVADAPVRCPRCNWAGRFPWLVGIDDGRNLAAVIRRADPKSVGARRPILPTYEGTEPLDQLDGLGDRRCAICAGRGYLNHCPRVNGADPIGCRECLAWELDRRLRRRPGVNVLGMRELLRVDAHEEEEDDPLGRASRGEDETEIDLSSADDMAEEPASRLLHDGRAEAAAAARLLVAALRACGGDLGIESAIAQEHIRDFRTNARHLRPLAERQLLVDLSVRGGGRPDGSRRTLFTRRELALVALFLLGYDAVRIAQGTGLSLTQVQEIEVLKEVRAFVETARDKEIQSLALEISETRRVPTRALAELFQLSERQVQRIIQAPIDHERNRTVLGFHRRLKQQPPYVVDFVSQAIFHWARPDIVLGSPRPFLFAGLPVLREGRQPYHSWLSRNDHAELRQLITGEPEPVVDSDGEDDIRKQEPVAWFIPGYGGVLPLGLFALLSGEVANTPLESSGAVPVDAAAGNA
jgi:hypothetical protein